VATPGRPKRGVIIGCGIAGPVLAIFLRRAGVEPVIYEGREGGREEAGSFLGLAPNGRDVLDTLGIRDQIAALGIPTPKIAFHNHKGKQLGLNPQPIITIKRGPLGKGLREAALAQGVAIEFGKRLVAVEQDASSVVARFADGSETQGDFLVGCDGIRSAVRRSIALAAPPPEYTELITNGSYARVDGLESTVGTMHMTFCKNGFFGYQVADDGEVWWFENFHHPTEPSQDELDAISDADWKRRLLDMHDPDHDPIGAIIAATEDRIARFPIHEMPILECWYRDRVCLAGDAAHAVGPHSGQGGSLAMEDAIVLATCLRDAPKVDAAFAAYQRICKERAEYVAHQTRRIGNRKAPPGPIGRAFRDLVLPVFLRQGVKTFEPIYAHHIEWQA
jgi:2-polyprenyl-6-methoxyphenol hydroxylase-like FAD-dependent oxidoreductase